jgi:hypothetical protein
MLLDSFVGSLYYGGPAYALPELNHQVQKCCQSCVLYREGQFAATRRDNANQGILQATPACTAYKCGRCFVAHLFQLGKCWHMSGVVIQSDSLRSTMHRTNVRQLGNATCNKSDCRSAVSKSRVRAESGRRSPLKHYRQPSEQKLYQRKRQFTPEESQSRRSIRRIRSGHIPMSWDYLGTCRHGFVPPYTHFIVCRLRFISSS